MESLLLALACAHRPQPRIPGLESLGSELWVSVGAEPAAGAAPAEAPATRVVLLSLHSPSVRAHATARLWERHVAQVCAGDPACPPRFAEDLDEAARAAAAAPATRTAEVYATTGRFAVRPRADCRVSGLADPIPDPVPCDSPGESFSMSRRGGDLTLTLLGGLAWRTGSSTFRLVRADPVRVAFALVRGDARSGSPETAHLSWVVDLADRAADTSGMSPPAVSAALVDLGVDPVTIRLDHATRIVEELHEMAFYAKKLPPEQRPELIAEVVASHVLRPGDR
ncbi:MAG: hypothetical protein ACOZNI_22050 [Myxococcota bacterium]